MLTANQVASAARIWTAFVTDKSNLSLPVSLHLPLRDRDCDGLVHGPIPCIALAIILHGQVPFAFQEESNYAMHHLHRL